MHFSRRSASGLIHRRVREIGIMSQATKALLLGIFCLSVSVTAQAQSGLTQFEEALENEAELVTKIRSGILALQGAAANASGTIRRGTHAKGVCAGATFEVLNLRDSGLDRTLVERLGQGIYARPGVYQGWARFANGKGSVNPDATPDVRSLSFAVDVPAGALAPNSAAFRQDFSMNNASTFPINDAQDFEIVLRAATQGPRSLNAVELARLGATLAKGAAQENQDIAPYQMLRYWSGTAFLHGARDAVKYSARPCATNSAAPLNLESENFLGEELARRLAQDARDNSSTCFEFQIQFLDAERFRTSLRLRKPATYWVENASADWNETDETPFITVGRLTLSPGNLMDQAACESLRINVNGNTHPLNRGIGSINRARTDAEGASAERRRARN